MAEGVGTEQLIARGKAAYVHGDYASALGDLREVVRREPGFADVHHVIGLCLSLIGRPEEAVESFDAALAINPRYAEAHVNRAITLQEIGRYDEARRSFEAASEVDMEEGVGRFPAVLASRLANRHMELGDLYAEGGAEEEAVEQFRRAVELRPRYVDIRNRLARMLLEVGRLDEAVEELRTILEINPNFFAARINLGLGWYRMGDLEGARREWERCGQQRPGHPQVELYLSALARSERGRQSPVDSGPSTTSLRLVTDD
jgi:tetratricopeptide (TPR) repeat protein